MLLPAQGAQTSAQAAVDAQQRMILCHAPYCLRLCCFAPSGTEGGYVATQAVVDATAADVASKQQVLLKPMVLRQSYAVSGTDLGDAATRCTMG
eukprot:161042-Rhodomonas_salina.1